MGLGKYPLDRYLGPFWIVIFQLQSKYHREGLEVHSRALALSFSPWVSMLVWERTFHDKHGSADTLNKFRRKDRQTVHVAIYALGDFYINKV